MEYAVDVALACRERGVRTVSVTAGYICPEPRAELYDLIDAANVDLKAFTERFYRRICGGHLQSVLETLSYIKQETDCWLEITTLLIPGENDSEGEIEELAGWIHDNLGADVPLHFTAFHPDWKMRHKAPTSPVVLRRARDAARRVGLRYVYTGNVHDIDGGSTYCHACGERLIARDWYELSDWRLTERGTCRRCETACAGVFEPRAGSWGARRQPIRLDRWDRAGLTGSS